MRIIFTRSREDEIKARKSFFDNQHAKMVNPPVLIYLFGFCYFVFFAYYDRPFSRSRMASSLSDEIFVSLCILLLILSGYYLYRILSIRRRANALFSTQDELDDDYFGEISVSVEQDRVLVDIGNQRLIIPHDLFTLVEISSDYVYVKDGMGLLPWIPTTSFGTFQQAVEFAANMKEPSSPDPYKGEEQQLKSDRYMGMEHLSSNGIDIYYYPEHGESAEVVREAAREGAEFIKNYWGLSIPEGTTIAIVRSWFDLFKKTSNLPQKLLTALLQPHVFIRFRRMWRIIGGVAGQRGKVPVIGLKSLEYFKQSDPMVGRLIYQKNLDDLEAYRCIVCHELTHTALLSVGPPRWLNEGVAMLTVDQMSRGNSVREGTRLSLQVPRLSREPRLTYRCFFPNVVSMFETYARSYWFVRYFMEHVPGLMLAFLHNRYHYGRVRKVIADSLGTSRMDVWSVLVREASEYFQDSLGDVKDEGLEKELEVWKEKYQKPRRIRAVIFKVIMGGILVIMGMIFMLVVLAALYSLISFLFF